MTTAYAIFIAPFTDFSFMQRALSGGISLSLAAPLVGIFLTLKRLSLGGDAITHAMLPGIAAAYLISGFSTIAMLIGGFIAGIVTILLSAFAMHKSALPEDMHLASFQVIALAIGVILISLGNPSQDLSHILFGNILTLDDPSIGIMIAIALMTTCGIAIIFRPLVIELVDPAFLHPDSVWKYSTHAVFTCLFVINIVIGARMTGALMAVGVMILPAISAQLWKKDFVFIIPASIAFSLVSTYGGLLFSFHIGIPTGPAIICIAATIQIVSLFFGRYHLISLRRRDSTSTDLRP